MTIKTKLLCAVAMSGLAAFVARLEYELAYVRADLDPSDHAVRVDVRRIGVARRVPEIVGSFVFPLLRRRLGEPDWSRALILAEAWRRARRHCRVRRELEGPNPDGR